MSWLSLASVLRFPVLFLILLLLLSFWAPRTPLLRGIFDVQPRHAWKVAGAAVMAAASIVVSLWVIVANGPQRFGVPVLFSATPPIGWLFLTSLVPSEKMREAALYGAEVVKVSGTYDETKHIAAEFAKRRGIHLDRGAKAIPGKESMKTLGFEIAEQLGLACDGGGWRAPDWYIQAVSGGIGPDTIDSLLAVFAGRPGFAGIDINSKVEVRPGFKSIPAIEQVLERIRR